LMQNKIDPPYISLIQYYPENISLSLKNKIRLLISY
jgi:hypothetical protein